VAVTTGLRWRNFRPAQFRALVAKPVRQHPLRRLKQKGWLLMFKQTGLSSTPRLFSTAGTYGEIDIVATDRGVTLSVTGRNYDTMGRLHLGNALTNLSVADAQRLSGLLQEAIAVSQDADPRQPGLWSEATLRNTRRRCGRRA
jgi:hypothetical protein